MNTIKSFDKVKVSRRLRELRDSQKWSQYEMGEELNKILHGSMSLDGENGKQTVSQLERGRRITIDIAFAYANVFDKSIDFILGWSDDWYPQNRDVKELTGLTDEAIANIKSVTSRYYDRNSIASKVFNMDKNITIDLSEKISSKMFTLEARDILNEFLSSVELHTLIEHISYLTKEYAEVKEVTPRLNKARGKNSQGDFTDRFHYQLWRANTTAQTIINNVLESYCLKTKDGVKTYTAIEEISKDGIKTLRMKESSKDGE